MGGGIGHYKLCIELRKHYKAKVSGQVAIAIRNAEKEMNEVQPKMDDGKEMNDGNGNGMMKCASCRQPFTSKRSKCSGCGKVAYCNSKCQRKHWKKHKKICKKRMQ